MNTTVEVKINNVGQAIGTVGFLAQQKIAILIGYGAKSGVPCGWLKVGDKSAMVSSYGSRWVDAYDNACWQPESGIINYDIARVDTDYGQIDYAFEVNWSDAAWEKIEELISEAQKQFASGVSELLQKDKEEAAALRFTVSRA